MDIRYVTDESDCIQKQVNHTNDGPGTDWKLKSIKSSNSNSRRICICRNFTEEKQAA